VAEVQENKEAIMSEWTTVGSLPVGTVFRHENGELWKIYQKENGLNRCSRTIDRITTTIGFLDNKEVFKVDLPTGKEWVLHEKEFRPDIDKRIKFSGPNGLEGFIDTDDVDVETVLATARTMIAILRVTYKEEV
jgi:hypothetical protein